MSDLSKNQQSIDTSGAHVDGGDVEALRAQFEKLLSHSGRACRYEGDGQYAFPHDPAWLWFQVGHAAATAETAAAVAAERERCLRIVESVDNYSNPMTANDCADATRAGVKEPSGDPTL